MMKKGDVIDNADDDVEVRTSASHNQATGLSIYSSPLISAEKVWGSGARNRRST
jgi:hypothetical protein